MLDTLFSSALGDTLSPVNVIVVVASALILGLALAFVYLRTHRDSGWQQSFVITLIMLPATLAIVIMLCENNIARAFSLGGAVSIIRFRSAPGDAKDIAYIFLCLAIGLSCGMGYIAYGVVFTLLMALVMIVLSLTNFAVPNSSAMTLRITIPENLNFENVFDSILTEYTKKWSMRKVRTTDYGSLFELVFDIELKDGADRKQFIDELRVKNGNLPVQLTLRQYEEQLTL